MKHYYQDKGSKTCGQTCLAMVLDISKNEAIRLVGATTKKGTTTKQIANALIAAGHKPNNRLKKYIDEQSLPETCMLVLKWKRGAHWVVYHRGYIFCPGRGIHKFSDEIIAKWKGTLKGYLDLGLKERIETRAANHVWGAELNL